MLTVNELFAGIGSQRAALERLGIEHKVVGIAEIDKFAIKSYEAIWGETKNYGDISKVEKLDYADFWTYSFPCQDISVAGKQAGINKHTRSGLLYEVERLLEKSKECGELPKYLMLENVKNLVGKKFKPQFEEWIQRLDELGYNTYWQVLNAKNYGIPQNRERVFGISIRKDVDTGYVFPEPFELKIRLKDILEKEVDEKFYINNSRATQLIQRLVDTNRIDSKVKFPVGSSRIGGLYDGKSKHQAGSVWDTNGLAPTVDTMQGGNRQPCIVCAGNINPSGNGMNGNVFDSEGLAPTLTTNKGEGNKILEPLIAASRGRNPNNPSDRTVGSPTEQRLEINKNGTSNTITTVQKDNYVLEPKEEFGRMGRQAVETFNEKQPSFGNTINPFNKNVDDSDNCPTITTRPEGFKTAILPVTQNYRIRKLTPKECWRLMGFTDKQFQKAQDAGISNSQLYKQAGNSIVVDVLYYIFRNLFTEKPKYRVQIDDEEQLLGQISILDFMN